MHRTVPPPLPRLAPVAQALLLALLPHGGQRTARRNAWAGRAADATRARAAREAAAAVRRAEVMAQHPAAQRPTTQRPTTQRPTTQRPAAQRPTTQRPVAQHPAPAAAGTSRGPGLHAAR